MTREPSRKRLLDLYLDILEIAKEPVSKTRIMYKVNLSFSRVSGYLKALLNLGLLEEIEQPIKGYKTTIKGLQVLEEFSRLENLVVMDQGRNPVPVLTYKENVEKASISPIDVKSVLMHIKTKVRVLEEKQLNAFMVDEVAAGLKTIPRDLEETSNFVSDYLLSINITAEIEVRPFVDKENAKWKTILLTIYVKDKTPEDILDLQHTIYSRVREKIHDLSKSLLVRVLPR